MTQQYSTGYYIINFKIKDLHEGDVNECSASLPLDYSTSWGYGNSGDFEKKVNIAVLKFANEILVPRGFMKPISNKAYIEIIGIMLLNAPTKDTNSA